MIFNVASMCFNAICDNKMLSKMSEPKVVLVLLSNCDICDSATMFFENIIEWY